MPQLQIGLIYYTDDPTQSVFRTVEQLPWEPASVHDDPAHVTNEILVDVKGKPIPGARAAVMLKVPAGNPQGLGGPQVGIGTSAADALTNLVNNAVPAVVNASALGATNAASIQASAFQAAQQAAALKGATPASIIAAAQAAGVKISPIAPTLGVVS